MCIVIVLPDMENPAVSISRNKFKIPVYAIEALDKQTIGGK